MFEYLEIENAREFKYTRHILKCLLPYSEKLSKPIVEPDYWCWRCPEITVPTANNSPIYLSALEELLFLEICLFSPHRLPKALTWSEGPHLWVLPPSMSTSCWRLDQTVGHASAHLQHFFYILTRSRGLTACLVPFWTDPSSRALLYKVMF